MTPSPVPHGTWTSPVTADLASRGMTAGQIAAPSCPGFQGDELWWIEPRPQEDGRSALMRERRADADAETVLPGPWNIRSRVIEYGGRPWATAADDHGVLVVFANFPDQRLYLYRPDTEGAAPRPLTPVSPSAADCAGRSRSSTWRAARSVAYWRSSRVRVPGMYAG